jgi:hypothetical protein
MTQPRVLRLNMTGPDVAEWQRTIGMPVITSVFDEKTEQLTRMWQRAKGLVPDGRVGPATRGVAAIASTLPPPASPIADILPTPAIFIGARHFTRGRYGSPITLVVLHTMENQEKPNAARQVAQWFAGPTSPEASAHYCVDDKEIVQCVAESDSAWCAPGANRNGLHIEHAGRAGQTPEQWADAYSEMMLRRSAALCADACRRHAVPIKRLSVSEVRAGASGICGHVDVTKAFHEKKGTHWDPGPHFPWAHYIELVIAADGLDHLKPIA